MSTMVERVAKAIYEKRNGAGCKPWSRLPQSHQEPYLGDARAAIEAMREPTDAMVESVCGTGLCPSGVSDIYIDMIDAALQEQEQGR